MERSKIPSPEEFFGFTMGADRKLARWDRIVEYFQLLGKMSDRIRITELGKTTEGNPFLLAVITSSKNMKNLEKIRETSTRLAYSNDLSETKARPLIEKGKAVVAITASLHATEVGGTQMSPELAYHLATSESSEVRHILDEVVLLLVPCANPDGNIMVVDWYNKWLGTEYEGTGLPWLYQKYTGHDNNRDVVMLNMVESKMLAKLLFIDWFPQAYIDHHHMGSYSARYYIPPFSNPADPNVDPLVWTEQQLYGAAMILILEQAAKTGVENQATYPAEFNPTFTRVTCWHGICGMLTESASAKLGTPIYVHPQQLQPSSRGRPEYRAQVNFPHPWPGGWWRLRDVVEQQFISSLAALEAAANYRETILRNTYLKAKRTEEKARSEPPHAFIFPEQQHDPLTALKLLQALLDLGVKMHRADKEFAADRRLYPKGTYIVFTSQITRPYLLSVLRGSLYHESPWTKTPEGSPVPTYDLASYSLAEFMGVFVEEAIHPVEGNFSEVKAIEFPRASVKSPAENGYLLDGRMNEAFMQANKLLSKGVGVYRVLQDLKLRSLFFPKGSFYVPPQANSEVLKKAAEESHLTFNVLDSKPALEMQEVKALRIALYQRFYGGNAEEGWTRWLLEQYGYSYTTVHDKDVKEGLKEKYDILILPSDATPVITGEKLDEYYEKRFKGTTPPPKYPPEYMSGIGKDGVEKIKEFVDAGGTLITVNEASNFALEELKLPLINVLKDLKPTDFFCPGSTLKVEIDTDSPMGYGIARNGHIVFSGGPAFQMKQVPNNEDYKVILSYPEEHILKSGWLIGEKYLSRRAALVDAKQGKGRVILYGFSPQLRGQTHATFKFLFNALWG